jgi:hypothetical protein
MSQASKTLKKIAAGEAYQSLETAIKEGDYAAVFTAYTQVAELLKEAEKEIGETIQNLPRQNREEDYQRFRSAFVLRSQTALPLWYWINSELEKQKVADGEVFALGEKGDPLVRTPGGKVVVIQGATLEKGDRVRFRVITEGAKISFGRVFALNEDAFYFVLSQETRDQIRHSLNALKDRIDQYFRSGDDDGLNELGEIMAGLEVVNQLAAKLKADEGESVIARVRTYRKRLMDACLARLVSRFLSDWEEKQVATSGDGDHQQLALALSAPGIFRSQAYETLKKEFLTPEKPRGYQEAIERMEQDLNSMDCALKLLDFEKRIDEAYPAAKTYLGRMDRLFRGLSQKAQQVTAEVGSREICDVAEIRSAIASAFSDDNLYRELRGAFRSAAEFFTLRRALVELQTRLGNDESVQKEAAIKPYLSRVITAAFGKESG